MKNLLFALFLVISSASYAQSLSEISGKYLRPRNTTEELREGLNQIENLCSISPQEKCNRLIAIAYYLIANNYYAEAWSTYKKDATLVPPILLKANELFSRANEYLPITEFTETQKNIMLNDKNYYEALVK